MDKIRIGYARVSSMDNRQELGLEVQRSALESCDKVFYEKQSGSDDDRPQLQEALTLAKELSQSGVEVSFMIYKLDRLTRKMLTLLAMIEDFNRYGISLISVKENIETTSPTGKLLCILLGYVAEMELENICMRTKEGLQKAREKGVKLGNKGIGKEKEEQIIALYQANELSVRAIAKKVQVSTSTIYNVICRNQVELKSKKQ
ncbi:recombinase family protein [Streptococcus himalayensis]|uniref:Integrase n=1 Tax=Streptococcus himalayensis TaxID=1888195 RepID=A0A917EEB6_9STRE|nr:recombinase family protein [Streptococcus himalayensis]GGE23530.1 integrase [Streptococcus himalayensis]